MDWSSLAVAVVTGLCAIAGQWIISNRNRRESEIDDAIREQKQADRLDQIDKKLDEHNKYASRFGAIEKSIVEIQKDIGYIRKAKK